MATSTNNNSKDNGTRYVALNGTTPSDEASESLQSKDIDGTLCGCGPCKPSWLQKIVGPKLFVAHAGFLLALYIGMSSYLHSIVTQIERQFELSSSEVGSLMIANDVAILCLVMFVSYLGHDSHRSRWLGGGSLLIALGLITCSLPHYLSDPIDPLSIVTGSGTNGRLLGPARGGAECKSVETATDVVAHALNESVSPFEGNGSFITDTGQLCEGGTEKGLGLVKWLLLGQIIVGIGASPIFPLTISYLDDCVQKHEFTTYTACLFISATLGPIFTLLLGSKATSLYVDFDRVDPDLIPDLPQHDPRWLGAWWLGFLVAGSILGVAAIPMLFYPKRMPKGTKYDEKKQDKTEDNDEAHDALAGILQHKIDDEGGNVGISDAVKGIIITAKRLILNPCLMMLILGGACDMAASSIGRIFGMKYMQNQFGLSPRDASIYVGTIFIPCLVASQIVSGFICRRFKFDTKECLIFVITVLCIGLVTVPVKMFIGCSNPPVAGINLPYSDVIMEKMQMSSSNVEVKQLQVSLHDACNTDCECPSEIFRPVCGADGVTYISPCHAGCLQLNSTIGGIGGFWSKNVYSNCRCVAAGDDTATSGLCRDDCDPSMLTWYIVLGAVSMFFLSLVFNPLTYITLRIVDPKDRSVAIGLKSLINKCLGFFPPPIYMGAIINSTCVYWQHTCGERGSCWLYDIETYRYAFFGTITLIQSFGVMCYFATYFFLRRMDSSSMKKLHEDGCDTKETVKIEMKEPK